ncbi:TetR/AcrR family transcriptional regulator [uncultured Microbacterium sp.]|uniref:Regulatory protein TetR n=1 Tax=uncultured Microbacterium sp. TaxID=191216 RepID=A0A1Y5NTX7_9MICO|nr:TetR/AcrR family transcriptional regulator [uncultured Microbacterium sp.]SBS69857.1 Regulatory protein TetR [uncultured Microbacterium sp.]
MARLGRDEWVDAAYTVFQTDGLAAVRVEAVARVLGSTKGSFYWHFADRRALLLAVLERWEQLETDGVIAELQREQTAGGRLAVLLLVIAHRTALRTGERTLYVDADAAGVADMVAGVTERRVAGIEELLTELGIPAAEARARAVVIVAAVLGYQQMTAAPWDAKTDPVALVGTLLRRAVDDAPRASEALDAWQRVRTG